MTAIYSIQMTDSETPAAWMSLCKTATPGNQDSGRVRYIVTTEQPEALEAALDADDDVIQYAEATEENLVICTSPSGWSLHAPGSTDREIAEGDAPYLVTGEGEPTDADYQRALDVLASR